MGLKGRLTDQAGLARALEISVRTVRRYPFPRRGSRYDVAECKRWWRARKAAERAGAEERRSPRTELEAARLRKAAALAAVAEDAQRELAASLVEVEDAAAVHEEANDAIRKAVTPLPREWAERFVGLRDLAAASKALYLFSRAVLTATATADAEEEDPPELLEEREPPATLAEARARRWDAEASRIELAARELAGEVVRVEEFERERERRNIYVRARIVSMPGWGARALVGLTSTRAAERALRELLEQALRPLEGIAEDTEP